MSAEMAIESLRILLALNTFSRCSFFEGAIAAAMEASFGKSLQDVKQAAENTRGMRKIA